MFSQHQRLMSSNCNNYGKLMGREYKRVKYRWKSVRDQPLFILMDLNRLFNNFKVSVARSCWEIETHMDFKTHELAQISKARVFQQYLDQSTNRPKQADSLCDRLYDLGNELETVNLEVDMLREQCNYLMDAEFKTVAARTDARLGILTVLAFVITPAGFVVSLFSVINAGTTQLVISTVVVAFFSILVYGVGDRLAERKRLPSDFAVSGRDHIDGDEQRWRYC
ncbi:hypothetical protein Daus18300_011403 [Diaporthe australafricana]|uniref:Uncharacterized protein n=1 Tax=Diaporthe australafricana TaxID=127596 RepID=A0ABR3W6W2_9PEZI